MLPAALALVGLACSSPPASLVRVDAEASGGIEWTWLGGAALDASDLSCSFTRRPVCER